MIKNSILAGIFIGIAGLAYLTIGGMIGAIAFSLGLVLVCYLDLPLFTGKAGSIDNIGELFLEILAGNFVGCLLVSLCIYAGDLKVESLMSILSNRASSTDVSTIFRGVMCGIVMDNIVEAYKRKSNPLPLLIGVPVFIMCGFYHCIADCFYYTLGFCSGLGLIDSPYIWILVKAWILSIVGNFIGCNIRRLLAYDF